MCGLVGFLSKSVPRSESTDLLFKMGAVINSRGPDDFGIWVDESGCVGMVHRRLSILDVSAAGHQPMVSECGRYVISYNGEIYNHLALRTALAKDGFEFRWRGHSDTETLLACFSVWGIERTLCATVGMFAIALWDVKKRVMVLARDRFGEKPLYWGWQNGTLLFGSELKALRVHPAFEGQVDRDALALLLRHNYIPSPCSIYKGIQKLLPGHYVEVNAGGYPFAVSQTAYWRAEQVIENGIANPFSASDAEAIDSLEKQLRNSIEAQMLSDVPLGAFLSGGVDSSVVVALMQQVSHRAVRTFSIGFKDEQYNEAVYAKAVAKCLGTEHEEIYVGPEEALAVIPRLPQVYCEPFADSSQIPTFLVSQMARRHVTVALSGDGGDELFGGYNSYRLIPSVWRYLSFVPQNIRGAIKLLAAGVPLPGRFAKLRDVLDSPSPQELYRAISSHWARPCDVVIGANEQLICVPARTTIDRNKCLENFLMAADASTYLIDDILVKVDRAAMANSLETRVPMLDHRVFELAWSFPLRLKIRDGKGKWILRQVLYRHVPRELIERPKKGFSVPLASWLRGPLRDWAEALLDETRLRSEGFLDPQKVRAAWRQHLEGRVDNSFRLWGVISFQAWLESQKNDHATAQNFAHYHRAE